MRKSFFIYRELEQRIQITFSVRCGTFWLEVQQKLLLGN